MTKRREFLQKFIPQMSGEWETRVERDGRLVHIVKPEGEYSVLYSEHLIRAESEDRLPKNINGFFPEWIGDYVEDLDGNISAIRGKKQYEQLFRELERRKVPLYFADLNFPLMTLPVVAESAILIFTETTIGLKILSRVMKKLDGLKRYSRRDVLSRGSKAAFAAWLLTPAISGFSSIGSILTKKGEANILKLARLSNKIHPEYLLSLTLRNVIIAHKEAWLMGQVGLRSHFLTVVGAGHTGIEDEILSTTEERMEFLNKANLVLNSPLIRQKYVYTAVRLDYDGASWRATNKYEIPDLKKLVTM